MHETDQLSTWLAARCARITKSAVDEVVGEVVRTTAIEPAVVARLHALAEESIRHQTGVAIGDHRPTIVFQPIVHLESGAIIAREAVVRFPGDDAPTSITGMAGLPIELELGALRATLCELSQAQDATFVCVNLSHRLLADGRLAELLSEFACDRIVLEVDGEIELARLRSLRNDLDRLRAHGVRFALNGVGTGRAKLEHVMAIEPEIIKIDVSDAQRLGRELHRRAVVAEIVDVGRQFGAFVIATGIESSEQISVAQDLGVDAGQGLLLLMSSPIPA
jgi:EAL domain-containing protein (putative c-di-GMP-specific phosphodiesterase class I)